MKKLFVVFSCILFMMSLALTVSAGITYENYDLSVSYDEYEYVGAMNRVYKVGGPISDVRGYTRISCANDQTGYASCTITDLDGTTYSISNDEKNQVVGFILEWQQGSWITQRE